MTQNKSFAELAMDQTRIPSDASAVTATLSKSLKDGEVLADGGKSYSSVQTAQDNASSWIKLPPATFNETLTIDTAGLMVVGSGIDSEVDGGSSDGIDVQADDVTLRDLACRTTAGGGNVINALTVDSSTGFRAVGIKIAESDRFGAQISSSDSAIIQSTIEGADENELSNIGGPRLLASGLTLNGGGDSAQIGLQTGSDSTFSNIVVNNTGERGAAVSEDDAIFTGIRVLNAGGDGFFVDSGSTDNLVADIRISGSAGTDFVDNGTSTLVATDDSGNPTIITDDTSGQQA